MDIFSGVEGAWMHLVFCKFYLVLHYDCFSYFCDMLIALLCAFIKNVIKLLVYFSSNFCQTLEHPKYFFCTKQY